VLAVYVEWNKQGLLEEARAAINGRINGQVGIGKMDVSLFRHFPSVMIRLSDVFVRDSAWSRHGHELLRATHVDIGIAPLRGLFRGKLELDEVAVEQGTVYFYTDSSGYSNTGVLRAGREKGGGGGDWPHVALRNVRWVIDKEDKRKLFDFRIRKLTAAIGRDDRSLVVDVRTEAIASAFSFRLEKGSFIRGKSIAGHFKLTYNTASHILQMEKARVKIDGYPFVFSGRFFPTVKPDPFFLSIDAGPIPFGRAAALLTPRLEQKLGEYDIDKPVTIHARLDAGVADEIQPQLQVRMNVERAEVRTPAGRFGEVSFLGSFTNEWVRGKGREDANSAIRLTGFTGRLEDIPLRSDTAVISNLQFPQLNCDLHSAFLLRDLNSLLGSQTLAFRKGRCLMDVRYAGPLSENDSSSTAVNGELDLDSAGIEYLPYSFGLDQVNGRLELRGQDLVVDRLSARTGKTAIRVKGVARNLIALIDHNAGNVSMDWSLNAAHLALEDFAGLAGSGSAGQAAEAAAGSGSGPATEGSAGSARRSAAGTAGPLFGAVAGRIDDFLKNGMIRLHLDAADVSYEHFYGAHAKADILFRQHQIRLSQVRLEQSSGALDLEATIDRRPRGGNPVTLESHLDHVDLPGLFTAFDDFGQEAIGARNLKGRMSADIRMTGMLTDRAKVAPNSLRGTIDFTITDGQLIDFPPMERIHETVLKKRDLSEIRFGTLQNRLEIDSTTITLHRMEIRSTAFTFYVQGTYDLRKGTDMSLQVPISNLKSRATDVPPESRGNDSRAGVSLRLRARTAPDGQLKVSWDPFRRALKKAKKH